MAGAAFVDLNTNAHSRADGTQVVNGRSGGFQVNYGGTLSGESKTPTWVWIAAGVAVVWMYTRRKG